MGLALACAVGSAGSAVPVAWGADPDGDVSQHEVDRAEAAVEAKATDVASVRARLAAAQQRLEGAQVAAARAGEAFNGARYESQQAAQASRLAQAEAAEATADLERQRAAYGEAVTSAYVMSPQLGALGAISQADGITDVLESTSALRNAEAAMQDRYDAYHEAATVAEAADQRAETALDDARRATDRARASRDEAQAAEAAAAAEADAYAAEHDRLIGQLARLQDISVELAAQREDQLAAQAAAQAAAEAAAAAQQQAEQEQQEQEEQQTPPPAAPTATASPTSTASPTTTAGPTPTADPTTSPTSPTTSPTSTPTATATPPPPPAPPPPATGDAAAAIAFARDQLGEPYRYGASGPSSWDCSGLTMRAWAAGGRSLPHYSVAQYQQSTPITLSQLQPGDLLFWSDGGPTSIYHVAIYTGNGMMIHAPRPGRTVEEVSMYYWVTPTYFARP
jgi:cell wall-associated NlpC family hydrolase